MWLDGAGGRGAALADLEKEVAFKADPDKHGALRGAQRHNYMWPGGSAARSAAHSSRAKGRNGYMGMDVAGACLGS